MARLNVEDTPIGPCPCGKGKIIDHSAEMDHGYGADSYWRYIACEQCREDWDIDGEELVNKSNTADRRPIRGA